MSECRSCGAEIVWMKTKNGRNIPVDPETATKGNKEFEPASGHISHFATCPFADDHRAGKGGAA